MAKEPIVARRRSDSLIECVQCTDDGAPYVVPQVAGAAISAANPVPTRLTNPTSGECCGTEESPLVVEDISRIVLARDAQGRWINEITPGAMQVVLTNGPAGDQPGIYYNLSPGEIVYVFHIMYAVHTLNDELRIEMGWTDAPNGGGAFTPITPAWYLNTGVARYGAQSPEVEFSVAVRLRYADGVRSLTMRVTCNDAACDITCGYQFVVLEV